MKRFLAFFGDDYYAQGGMLDFIGDFDTMAEATDAIAAIALPKMCDYDNQGETFWGWHWSHVWDSETRTRIDNK